MNITKLYLTILVIALTTGAIIAQDVKNADISGSLLDENSEPLESATLMLLNAADSVLVGFTTSESDGSFSMKRVDAGDYLLKINFLGYSPLFKDVNIGDSDKVDVGQLQMELAAEVLGEVEVTADHIPIEIRKDTISYNADAFKTQPNAAVEDLLKKLPGMEVDQEGNIKAQGEDVQKVLVDGKEFFGSDPKIATKNLPADAIDKIEVFDRKSDMTEFSGIDDGEREKTINLKLREDKKKGMFGNLEAGYGTDERYSAKANLNRFSKNSQLAFLGLANNVNEQGFSVNDFLNFSGGMSRMMGSGGGRIRTGGDNAVPISQGLSDGLAKTLAGGVNYNLEFADKFDLRSSYFYNGINNQITQDLFRQDFVNDTLGNTGTIETQTQSESTSKNDGHRVAFNLEYEIDSIQELEITTNGSFSNGESSQFEDTETYGNDGALANTNSADYNSDDGRWSFEGDLAYRRKFTSKRGRTLSLRTGYDASNSNSDGRLMSLTEYINSGDERVLDQIQEEEGNNRSWNARASYTEPIGKNKWLELNYRYQNNSNESDKSFYDVDVNSGDEIFNPVLSTFFTREFNYHRAGASVKWNTNKSQLDIGLQYQDSDLRGFINDNESPIEKNFGSVLPSLRWRYELGTAKSLRFDYRTSISVPSVQQLSPIVDNSDPLKVYIGNPDLNEEYQHNMNMHFHSFSQFSNTSVFAMIRTAYTKNKIVNSTFINPDLQRITSPVNIDNDWNVRLYGSFSTPLKFIHSRVRVNLSTNYNKTQEIINRVAQDLNRWNNTFGIEFQTLNSDVIELTLGGDWTNSKTNYESNLSIDQSYFIQHYYTDITINFLKTWSVGTSFDVRFYSGAQFNGDESLPLWKAQLSKYVFKDRRAEIRLSVFDVLDENRGISRTANANYIEEIKSNALGQYAMLSFIYSIKGFGAQPEQAPHWMTRRRR